ncbi:MAG: cellulase family glycosylhydrolase [Chloroflexota bacterium]
MRYVWLMLLVVVGCAPRPPVQPALQAVTAVPSLAGADVETLCNIAMVSRDTDPRLHIEVLMVMDERGTSCADIEDAGVALYDALTDHAEQLEAEGRSSEAERYYRQALNYTETDSRARDALQQPGTATAPDVPSETCDAETVQTALDSTPPYAPQQGTQVALLDSELLLDGQPFVVRSVQYEPRDFPGRRFMGEATTEAIETELALIAEAGFNTVRVNLIYDALFRCIGNGAVPVPEAFARLDAALLTAIQRGMRVVPVLHHQPDLSVYPLYGNPEHTTAQTAYLVQRYAEEPGILAWDLRDGGDRDYTEGDFEREVVVTWITQTAQRVRQTAPEQLITAGWRDDAAATAPFVDFVSFQHDGNVDELRQQITLLRTQTNKPLFLAGVGYPTANGDEPGQRDRLFDALEAAENNQLLGWNVVEAFDHPATVCEGCGRFGLWNTSYFPKLALEAPQNFISR